MIAALRNDVPAALRAAGDGVPRMGAPTNLREYDPEWGDAFWTERVGLTCDYEAVLTHVEVPVLFTHHGAAVTEWLDELGGLPKGLPEEAAEEGGAVGFR
jgi:hypothetical protein